MLLRRGSSLPNIKQDEDTGRKGATDKNAEYMAKYSRRNSTTGSSLHIHHMTLQESCQKGDEDRALPFGAPGTSILRNHSSSRTAGLEPRLRSPCSSVCVEVSSAHSSVSVADAVERIQAASSLATIGCSGEMEVLVKRDDARALEGQLISTSA